MSDPQSRGEHEVNYDVRFSDTDLFQLCRPSALLNDLQETAAFHAEKLGIGVTTLMEQSNAIWMLVRQKYELLRPLYVGEHLRIQTWFYEPKGMFILRDFAIYVGDELVGQAYSTWVLGDVQNHTLLRGEDVLQPYHVPSCPAKTKKLGKIRMPKDMEPAGKKRIGYSETDINGHANNTRYADYACDTIELEQYQGKYVKSMQITYSAECLAGDTVSMLRKEDNGIFYVRGVDKDGKPHFDIRMELAEI